MELIKMLLRLLLAFVIQGCICQGLPCSQKIYGLSGSLHSPNFPGYYPSSSDCVWNITAPEGYHVKLTFIYLSVGSSDTGCLRDHVSVHREHDRTSGNNIGKYCGGQVPSPAESNTRFLGVVFVSATSNTSKGFFAYFTAIPDIQSAPVNPCSNGWTEYKTFCYQITAATKEYDSALNRCKDDGASLLTVSSEDENFFAVAMLLNSGTSSDMLWLGMNYGHVKGRYAWEDGTPLIYTRWKDGELDKRRDPNATCARLERSVSWTVAKCGSHYASFFICQQRVTTAPADTNCTSPLGLQNNYIPDSAITYSSRNVTPNGWIALLTDLNQWIQVYFTQEVMLTAIATQGIRDNDSSWVTQFSLSFSRYNTSSLVPYVNPMREPVLFQGNIDSHNVIMNRIERPFIARQVRVNPRGWRTKIALEMELFGCNVTALDNRCSLPLGLERGAIEDFKITASSPSLSRFPSWNARLNLDRRGGVWKSSNIDTFQWIQVSFGQYIRVTGIATQGGTESSHERVAQYVVTFSHNGVIFEYYKRRHEVKIFSGNTDMTSVVKHSLEQPITVTHLRIHPVAWHVRISARMELYGCSVSAPPPNVSCSTPLGLESRTIPDANITASPGNVSPASRARLNFLIIGEYLAWVTTTEDQNQWIMVRLNGAVQLTGIATQGRNDGYQWVTKYILTYSTDGEVFQAYTSGSSIVVFRGNWDRDTIVRHHLSPPVIATTVCLRPRAWHNHIALRFELYGCRSTTTVLGNTTCSSPMGMQDGSIPSHAIIASSQFDGHHTPDRARLHNNTSPEGWRPRQPSSDHEWIQVDFGRPVNVTAIATQGVGNEAESFWVTGYMLQHSMDGQVYSNFTYDNGTTKIFEGNFDRQTVVKYTRTSPISTRYLRVVPTSWKTNIGLRLEVYGCGYTGEGYPRRDEITVSCVQPLGLEDGAVYKGNISASSRETVKHYTAHLARLNRDTAWTSQYTDIHQWIQVEFDGQQSIAVIATQGKSGKEEWVTQYNVNTSYFDTNAFQFYRNTTTNEVEIFKGNSDQNSVVTNPLKVMAGVRIIRVIPVAWHGRISMRLEFFGCFTSAGGTSCAESPGMQTGIIKDSAITSSSSFVKLFSSWRGRLRHVSRYGSAWEAKLTDTKQWLQVDFSSVLSISGVATQGARDDYHWVTSYLLRFSRLDAISFETYQENGKDRVFWGNSDADGIVMHYFDHTVQARLLRLNPLSWYNRIAVRMEFYGCRPERRLTVMTNVTAKRMGCFDYAFSIFGLSLKSTDLLLNTTDYSPIKACALVALKNRWKAFAVLNSKCYSSAQVYNKYATAEKSYKCFNWDGGNRSLDVFLLEGNCTQRTKSGYCCVFPFFYNNDQMSSCVGFGNNTSWCSITPNFDKHRMRDICDGIPVNGGFTPWSNWTECSSTCAGGTQRRMRNCTNPSPEYGGAYCNGTRTENKECNTRSCDGRFSNWSSWGACNKTGGTGIQQRTIIFTNNINGTTCQGFLIESTLCENSTCPSNNDSNAYTVWSTWSVCNKSCLGFQQRTRNYTNPFTSLCNGSLSELGLCNTHCCPNKTEMTGYTEWSSWNMCNETCNGFRHRNRNHTDLLIRQYCNDLLSEASSCNRNCCPDKTDSSSYTEWTSWSACNESCSGFQQRTRNYTNILIFGRDCNDSLSEVKPCNAHCSANKTDSAGLSEWGSWNACNESCGTGVQYRVANYTNTSTAPRCTGSLTVVRLCNTHSCLVNETYSPWSNWSVCNMSCGSGTRQRTRYCIQATNISSNCSQRTVESLECNTDPCLDYPINGSFSQWTNWTECARSCGTGNQQRMRTCTNPPPANGGLNCTGHTNETQVCNTQHCPIDGNWTQWTEWSYCNRPCGTGYNNRTRSCTNPSPMYGGKNCTGVNHQAKPCNPDPCPAAEVEIIVRFTGEICSEALFNLTSPESQTLIQKIRTNMQKVYARDPSFRNVKVNYFRCGSVISNFTVLFNTMDSLQLVTLQENIRRNGLLNTMPVLLTNITTTEVPSSSPKITQATNTSSTAIRLQWFPVSLSNLHGLSLGGYSIFYRETTAPFNPNTMKSVPSDINTFTVEGLKKFTNYSFRILAFTANGNGIPSRSVSVITDEDVPSQSPPNFMYSTINSTALSFSWSSIDKQFVHGVFKGYNITLTSHETSVAIYKLLGPNTLSIILTNLRKFTYYSVKVCGFTAKGCGPPSKTATLRTLEDIPSLPPANPTLLNLSSTSTIQVNWAPVPRDNVHGILRGYKLTFKKISTSLRNVQGSTMKPVIIRPGKHTITLSGLTSFSMYKIQIAAFTNVGLGPYSQLYGETCRCPRVMPTNYWVHNPYLNFSDAGKIGGIFPGIVQDMTIWACADCVNGHGKTVMDFKSNGQGHPAMKKSMLYVASDIYAGTRISFPVNGNKDMTKFHGLQPFIPLLQSPGVAFLVTLDNPDVSARSIFLAVVKCGPMVLFSLLAAYLASILIWFLDRGAIDSCFPRSFIKGVYEGFWWSFISMTTVGYGDRSPQTVPARLFAIIWTLYGLVLVSFITSAVTTSLTTVTMDNNVILYGTQIAAVQNSSEYRLGILKNAKVNQVADYHNLEEIHQALLRGEVKGALIDTYVVAPEKTMFQDGKIIVRNILERPFGYGIALSGVAERLQYECRTYVQLNAARISKIIEASTEQLQKPAKSAAEEKSTGLFDITSAIFRKTMLLAGTTLCFAAVSGITWHFFCYTRKRNLVTNKVNAWTMNSTLFQLKKDLTQDMGTVVNCFYEKFRSRMKKLRDLHRVEIMAFMRRERKRKKRDDQLGEGNISGNEKVKEKQIDKSDHAERHRLSATEKGYLDKLVKELNFDKF